MLALALALALVLWGRCPPAAAHGACFAPTDDEWWKAGEARLKQAEAAPRINSPARNVILFVGDGMDLTTVTAARILQGQQRGETGEENYLSWERNFPYTGLSKTYTTDSQVPDSAGTATALMTGSKTRSGMIGVAGSVLRGDCEAALKNPITNIAEWAKSIGLGVGVVTTAAITDATPGAVYSHSAERYWQYRGEGGLANTSNCTDIASQMTRFSVDGAGLDVMLGGGRRNFLPAGGGMPAGVRGDGVDLVREWQGANPAGRYVNDTASLREAVAAMQGGGGGAGAGTSGPLLGLFADSDMDYDIDRDVSPLGQPALSYMAEAAITLLQQRHPGGYFLLIEAGRIDHGNHAGQAGYALTDTIELSKAVEVAMNMTDPEETLLVVTADHGHTTSLGGYPTRGNNILGKVVGNNADGTPSSDPSLGTDGKPYTSLGYLNGPGSAWMVGATSNARPDQTSNDTAAQDPPYRQQSAVPLEQETHGGQDVGVWARGPAAHMFSGSFEENYVFFVMRHALRIDDTDAREKAFGKMLLSAKAAQTIFILGACLVILVIIMTMYLAGRRRGGPSSMEHVNLVDADTRQANALEG